MEGVIALFIPIIITLVTGLVIVAIVYINHRKHQLLIEKGFSAQEIKLLLEKKESRNVLLKLGIICIFFGIGLGVGLMFQDWTGKDYYVPFGIFVGAGIGFVLANYYGRKLDKENSN